MNILAIDTSSDQSSVALVGENFSAELQHFGATEHGEYLPQMVADLIRQSGLKIDLVLVGMGPGPFTGLRVGIAFAQAYAFASGAKFAGICSLDVIAHQHLAANPQVRDFYISTDARRKERFLARYVDGHRQGEPSVRMTKLVSAIDGEVVSDLLPSALALVAAWQSKRFDVVSQPIYLRRPDAYPAPAGVKFRAMSEFDLPVVLSLEREIFAGEEPWSKESFIEELRGGNRQYLVAEKEGQVVGYSGALVIGDVVDVTTLAVSPMMRRQGVARELVKRAIDWSRNQKVSGMMLEVRIGNDGARALYESLGFYPLNIRKDYYGSGIDAQVMRKDF